MQPTFGEQGRQCFEMTRKTLLNEEASVHPLCSLESVEVVDNYSIILTREDVSYDQLGSNRVMIMQLLRRTQHASKWTLWVGNSVTKVDEDTLVSMNFQVKETVYDHFDLVDAKWAFEKEFLDKT